MLRTCGQAWAADQRPRYTFCMARVGAYLLGRMAGKQFRKAKWMWASATGSEDEAIRAEQAVGREMAATVREDARGPVDPAVQAALDDVAAPLAAHVRNRAYRFEVAALAADEPNAFALPGGYIFVAPALLQLAGGGRDELAFIVAHEMAHVIRRHAIDRILSQRALQAVTLASPAARSIAPWVRTVGVRWLEKAYSRDQEYEADELGGRLMRAAGFDPAGAIRMLELLRGLERDPSRGLGGWLSTHPPTTDRIHRLRDQLDIR